MQLSKQMYDEFRKNDAKFAEFLYIKVKVFFEYRPVGRLKILTKISSLKVPPPQVERSRVPPPRAPPPLQAEARLPPYSRFSPLQALRYAP